MEHYGTPAIFHSDQGSQFTANRLTGCLKQAGVMLISGVWREKKEGRILLDKTR
jgi:hypothetical protein